MVFPRSLKEKDNYWKSSLCFEDEKCHIPEGKEKLFEQLPLEYSHLYLAIEGELAAVICIEDPLREEAADAIRALKESGISKVVMMTGDSDRTARAIAGRVGVDQYFQRYFQKIRPVLLNRKRQQDERSLWLEMV